MKVNSTELQNNFGKYLLLAAQEEIIVTRNGTPIARLTGIHDDAKKNGLHSDQVKEQVKTYNYTGKKATYEEFLELTKESEERYEYIDGEIFLLSSPKTIHQWALGQLYVHFHNWFLEKNCTPMLAPYDIRLKRYPEDKNVVQPDLVVICDLDEKLDENDYYQGVPSLVVEILSEGTRSKDLIKKLDLYMSCGVGEYWIVNPMNKEVTIYLFEEKNIKQSATYKEKEKAQSFLYNGLTVELERVFK